MVICFGKARNHVSKLSNYLFEENYRMSHRGTLCRDTYAFSEEIIRLHKLAHTQTNKMFGVITMNERV